MEAWDSYGTPRTVAWKGDWDGFKRRSKPVSIFNGTSDAVKMGESIAQDETTTLKEIKVEEKEWSTQLKQQSRKLAAMLLLSLEETTLTSQEWSEALLLSANVSQSQASPPLPSPVVPHHW